MGNKWKQTVRAAVLLLLGAWLAACGQGERDGSDGSAAAEGVRAPIALETLAKGFYPERFPQSSH